MKTIITILLGVVLMMPGAEAGLYDWAQDTKPNLSDAMLKTVSINAFNVEHIGGGSGLFMSDDYHILTNAHVVKGATSILICADYSDKDCFLAKTLHINYELDLAILTPVLSLYAYRDLLSASPPSGKTPFFKMRRVYGALETGDDVWVLGYPDYNDPSIVLTKGIDSGHYKEGNAFKEGLNMTDAKMSKGSSGGPVFDNEGVLVGISTAITISGEVNNIGLFTKTLTITSWFEEIGYTNHTTALIYWLQEDAPKAKVPEPKYEASVNLTGFVYTGDGDVVDEAISYIGYVFSSLSVKDRIGLQQVFTILGEHNENKRQDAIDYIGSKFQSLSANDRIGLQKVYQILTAYSL